MSAHARDQDDAATDIGVMHFLCCAACDRECARNVGIEDLAEDVERIGTCIALARDGCTGDEAADGMAKYWTDCVECRLDACFILDIEVAIVGLGLTEPCDIFNAFCSPVSATHFWNVTMLNRRKDVLHVSGFGVAVMSRKTTSAPLSRTALPTVVPTAPMPPETRRLNKRLISRAELGEDGTQNSPAIKPKEILGRHMSRRRLCHFEHACH